MSRLRASVPDPAPHPAAVTAQGCVGYTTGVFDLLHVGHVRLLQRARQHCDHLIVGVASDALSLARKGKRPVQGQNERIEIVSALKCVDRVVLQDRFDNRADWVNYRYHRLFKGDDWKDHPDWVALQHTMAPLGVEIVFLPYTPDISSTRMREVYAQG